MTPLHPATRSRGDIAPRVLFWLAVGGLIGFSLWHARQLGINDDAFITYRVARNLATGAGPVFNPGERVLSITTPGYMVLLAAGGLFSRDFVALGLLWSGLGLAAAALLLADHHRFNPAAGWATAVSVAVFLSYHGLRAAIGMETPLYIAALLGVFAAYRRAWEARPYPGRWLLLTAACAAAAFLLRPDGLLVGVVVGLHWLLSQRRVPWRAAAVLVALTAPWLLAAWAYYGSPVPNTLAAKITQGLHDPATRWGGLLATTARAWVAATPAAAALAALGLLLAWLPTRSAQPTPQQCNRRLMAVWAALYITLHTAMQVRGYFWYYLPLLALVALWTGDGLAAVVRWLRRRLPAQPMWALGLSAALTLVVLAPVATTLRGLLAVREHNQRYVTYYQTATLLHPLCQQAGYEPVGASEIGLLGYFSDCRIVDFSGLLQSDLAHLRLDTSEKMQWTIMSASPPLLVLSGSDGFPFGLVEQNWFRQRYQPVNIQDDGGFRSILYQRGWDPPPQRDLPHAVGWSHTVEPITTTLLFPPDAPPAAVVHAFLPAGSTLAVTINGETHRLTGSAASWQEYPLALPAASSEEPVMLALSAKAHDQPASVSWITSNALPAGHDFVPVSDLGARPRPRLELEPGQGITVTLAAAPGSPAQLELLMRDRPGVRLEITVNGAAIGPIGGADSWFTQRLPIQPDPQGRAVIALHNRGAARVGLARMRLIPLPDDPALRQTTSELP